MFSALRNNQKVIFRSIAVATVGISAASLNLNHRIAHADARAVMMAEKEYKSVHVTKVLHNDLLVTNSYEYALPKNSEEESEGDEKHLELEQLSLTTTTTNVPDHIHEMKSIGVLANGGEGISKVMPVIQKVLEKSENKTFISLVFANDTEDQITMKQQLDDLAAKHSHKFKVTYVVAQPTPEWKQTRGEITRGIVSCTMPTPSKDTMILVSGPQKFVNTVSGEMPSGELSGFLKELRYTPQQVLKL